MRKIKVRQVVIDVLEFVFERGKLPSYSDVAEKHGISEKNARLILSETGVAKLCNQMIRLRLLLDEESTILIESLYKKLKKGS